MKSISKNAVMLIVLIAGVAMQVNAAKLASKPSDHPAYLKALSDLRKARWLIEHRGNWQATADEIEAVKQIDAAMAEIKKAAIDDGKSLDDHTGMEDIKDHGGRLRKAAEYIKYAREDVNKEEDNGYANGLKARALEHLEGAWRATQRAISAGGYK